MNTFPKYGKIENLYRNNQVLEHACVVMEKIHGTNVRLMFCEAEGGLVLGGRNKVLYKDGQRSDMDGFGFTAYVLGESGVDFEVLASHYDGYIFFGEFHGANIQKGVKYSDEKDFRVFDIMDRDHNFLNWERVVDICAHVGLKTVPTHIIGMINLDDLNQLIDAQSITALANGFDPNDDNIAEGVVIKPLKMKKDHRGNWIRAKYKSNKWSENVSAPKTKRPSPEKAELQARAREFAEMVVTPGRVATIIEHITREGNTELSMSRTGEFLREFINDVMEEHDDVYGELNKNEKNTFNKTVNGYATRLWRTEVTGLK